MKIKSLHIKNFKSIVDLKLIEPNPFTVFVGPNGAGKSNIFEALEFMNLLGQESDLDKKIKIENKFGLDYSFVSNKNKEGAITLELKLENGLLAFIWQKKNKEWIEVFNIQKKQFDEQKEVLKTILGDFAKTQDKEIQKKLRDFFGSGSNPIIKQFDNYLKPKYETVSFVLPIAKNTESNFNEPFQNFDANAFSKLAGSTIQFLTNESLFKNFSRVFVGNNKNKTDSRNWLRSDASNLDKILQRNLDDDGIRDEMMEWLNLLVPEFENLEFRKNQINGRPELRIFEKHSNEPFDKSLISDGTYNILALLTAVYQSDEPQFLCIEEPENGLNPYVVRKLVDFFRAACQEKGHYIWLNTHSHDLVACLEPEEVVVVDKIGGETKVKQIKGMNLHGLDMAEVWLSGALGGGTPW